MLRLPQAKAPGRHHEGNLRRSVFMATSHNGWSDNYLVGLLLSLYHNSAPVNKKIQGALGGDFGDPSGPDYGFNEDVDEANCQFNCPPNEGGGPHAVETPTFR